MNKKISTKTSIDSSGTRLTLDRTSVRPLTRRTLSLR